jgi:hypothetical protein
MSQNSPGATRDRDLERRNREIFAFKRLQGAWHDASVDARAEFICWADLRPNPDREDDRQEGRQEAARAADG